jgi:hypothetical protein
MKLNKKILVAIVCISSIPLISFSLFIGGIYVGHFKVFPFPQIQSFKNYYLREIRNKTRDVSSETYGTKDILYDVIRDPVASVDLKYKAITSLEEIKDRNEDILTDIKYYRDAYSSIRILSVKQEIVDSKFPIISLEYSTNKNIKRIAYAYGSIKNSCPNSGKAILIIPGSGFNQSSAIWSEDQHNYQYGIVQLSRKNNFASFVLIKPNEDYLAWHDGKGNKLTGAAIYAWQLNRNGSYSASYLIDSIAITKWLQSCDLKTVIVAGISQGGAAAMLNAQQSKPNGVIVASGHSLMADLLEWSDPSQITGVPDYSALTKEQGLEDMLGHSSSKWFFSWGKNEYGIYRMDAMTNVTSKAIKDLKNVTTISHTGVHQFPLIELSEWLKKF